MIATTTTATRSTRIVATTLLPLLAATCSSFALLPPPTTRRVATPRVLFSSKSSSSHHLLPTTPSTWIGAKRLSVMSLSATEKDENNDTKEQENTSPLATNDDEATNNSVNNGKAPLPPKKLHSVTVCMVPPPDNEHIWEQISEMRRTLKDPGFYRWPPHANLLYPFLELGSVKNEDSESRQINLEAIVTKLQTAMRQCPPFHIQLRQFGTFGGKQRGVLWLDPESFPLNDTNELLSEVAPLIQLHSCLEEAFPSCQAQSQKSNNGFTPHMTLSHFEDLEAAKAAQDLLCIPNNLEFVLDRIYLLERIGDDGQFLRVAEIGLGESALSPEEAMFDPPAPFPGMPTSEEDWVHAERMKLKSRRNGKGRGGGGRGKKQRRRRPWNPRVPDTPEVIAAKRAERKAKREQLEREREQQQQQATGGQALLE